MWLGEGSPDDMQQPCVDATVGLVMLLRKTNPAENTYLKFMPPFAGTEQEARELALYLQTLRRPAAE